MRRAVSNVLPLVLLAAAALTPGAAVFAQDPDDVCALDRSTRDLQVDAVDVIVVGAVHDAGGQFAIAPEAYLKGAATGEDLLLLQPPSPPLCTQASLSDGDRVLVFLLAGDRGFAWPAAADAYVIRDGVGTNQEAQPESRPETELVEEIEDLTGQYAVPADDPGDGASIEWVGTVLPVTLGLLAILGISLVMLREWHRIDPS